MKRTGIHIGSALVLCALCLCLTQSITHPSQRTPEVVTTAPLDTALVATSGTLSRAIATVADELPQDTYLYDTGTLAAVNFQSTWGNKDANITAMTQYIEQAAAQGVALIAFPELCLTGYTDSDDPTLWEYQMPISLAESIDGPTAAYFSTLAQEHQLWIIYGASETAPGNQAYNAAFVCGPDGTIQTYQKIAPIEGAWCADGSTPLIIDTDTLGRIGIGICYDTYFHPELSAYYQAMDCDLYINLTASSQSYTPDNPAVWQWYYTTRLETLAYQTGMSVLSANLVGSCSWRTFPGGSVLFDTAFPDGFALAEAGLVTNASPLGLVGQTDGTDEPVSTDTATVAQWYEAIAQVSDNPKYTYTATAAPTVAMAPGATQFIDYATTCQTMVEQVLLAADQGADIVLFPDQLCTQAVPGTLTQTLSQWAVDQKLYILFAMTQAYLDDDGHLAYAPVMVVLHPDGTIQTHQADQTTVLSTAWGKLGICLGDVLYTNPLLARYYAAMGCKGLLHIGTTDPTAFQMDSVLPTYVDRDGLAIASCTPGTSLLITPFITADGSATADWTTGSSVTTVTGDGPTLQHTWPLQNTGFSISYFNATDYAQWFAGEASPDC